MYIQFKALRAHRHKRTHKNIFKVLLALSLSLTLIAACFGSAQIGPVLFELEERAALSMVSSTINDSYEKIVKSTDMTYEDLVQVKRNEQGQITSITMNSELLNLMCIQLNNDISERLHRKKISVCVPLGSLTRTDILSGKGPVFTVSISQTSTVDTYTVSAFKEAGVNQSEHTITMMISVTTTSLLPSGAVTHEYSQPFIVTQSVIVGDVPSYFLNE